MALTKQDVYQVEVTEGDHVQVRVKTLILEDGIVISSSLHRHVISPGQDYSGEIGKVRRMAQAAHVPTVVDRETTRQLYELAKRLRQDAIAAKDAAVTAHEAAVASGGQADIDAALILRDEAIAARNTA